MMLRKTYLKEARNISMNIGSQRPVGSEESLFKCRTNRAARSIYPQQFWLFSVVKSRVKTTASYEASYRHSQVRPQKCPQGFFKATHLRPRSRISKPPPPSTFVPFKTRQSHRV